MRIAIIAPGVHHQAGPAKVTATLVERLCENHQVSVFSHTIEGIDLSKIKHYKVPAVTRPKFLAYITFLVSSTIILIVLSFHRKRSFDIIHSAGCCCAFPTDVITSHFCEKEGLRLERSNIIEMPPKNIWRKPKVLDHRIYRRLAAFAEGVIFGHNSPKARIVVSQSMKREFIRHYGDAAESIIVIPNGVDLKMFNPANRLLYRDSIRRRYGISRSEPVLMFAGGDWERKGLLCVIGALSLLIRPNVKLLVVGSGDSKFYGQFAELKRVRERITFVPHSSILWEYYAASDVFVFPTIYEPFGLVIAEAMASGLPIITSRVAGAADLIVDGVNGLLLRAPSDVDDLAAKIELLLSNAELRKTMGERARETAEKISWDWVAQKTITVYNRVLSPEVYRGTLDWERSNLTTNMPRDLPIGNGNLLINFDTDYNIRDIYYPYIGKENHTEGCVSRTGIWVDGSFTWIDSPQWQKEMVYESDSLVTQVTATNPKIGLTLTFSDLVDFQRDIFFRRVNITNQRDHPRDVRLFFHYALRIRGREIGDTIYYHPRLRALVMYKEQRYFLAGGQVNNRRVGIDDWTTGSTKSEDKQSAWRDAEDGKLEKVPLTCGFAEGVIGLYDTNVPAGGSSTMHHWLAAGTHFHGVEDLGSLVEERGPESFIIRTRDYWRAWVNKESLDFADLPASILELYRRSLLTMRVQIDNRGAAIASTDSDITEVLGDTYSYVWGRDGAFAAKALDMAHYDEVSHQFFDFCADVITSEGYLLHKYTPDGSLAGQWMPWADEEGKLQLPIQEDETALVLYSLWHHYYRFHNVEFIRSQYRTLIKNAADFMVSYREPYTNLPAPSYDLWEERRGIHSFTVAAVWAGLRAAANFTEMFGEVALTKRYRQAAAEIKEAAIEYLFDKKLKRFLRSIKVDADGVVEPDYIIDSSICGPFLFGMLQATDPLIESTMVALMDRLWCKTEVGGIARYENDRYQQVSQDTAKVPGNPWFVCTMWIAQYYIARAQSVDDLKPALQILIWAQHHALPSGVLAEQVHPYSCAPLSVSPLTWSHAAVVIAIHEYIDKYRELRTRVHHRQKDR